MPLTGPAVHDLGLDVSSLVQVMAGDSKAQQELAERWGMDPELLRVFLAMAHGHRGEVKRRVTSLAVRYSEQTGMPVNQQCSH